MANTNAELIAYLKTVDTATLANAIELLNLRPRAEGYASLDLKCLFPEFGPMCGYAVTAHAETVTLGAPKTEEAYVELFEAVEASPKPAVVVIQEIGGDRDRATHAGEVMATIFTRLGAIGLVSDCGVRDLTAVRKIGFHYFARGAVASHASYRIVRSGVPVEVAGVTIRPGDMLHADENGLITVPESGRERLPELVENILAKERTLLDFVRSENFKAAQLRGRFLH
ncbi:MAG TPA: RraA family protein [Bryobacteraceae bacterium]|jgi:4-hydroxy-4-methyl-2-oxoglutarate aldolase|nr:RraA family protein [Bryobacteraceae bacterium]